MFEQLYLALLMGLHRTVNQHTVAAIFYQFLAKMFILVITGRLIVKFHCFREKVYRCSNWSLIVKFHCNEI